LERWFKQCKCITASMLTSLIMIAGILTVFGYYIICCKRIIIETH
jgi:hypothetical protein